MNLYEVLRRPLVTEKSTRLAESNKYVFEVLNGRTGYVLNMFTVKEYRKHGIGSLLFEKLIQEAKKRNLDKIELHATKDGEPIYRQFGFIWKKRSLCPVLAEPI